MAKVCASALGMGRHGKIEYGWCTLEASIVVSKQLLETAP